MKSEIDVNSVYQFGDQYPLNRYLDTNKLLDDLEKYKDKWIQYNPRKPINREGLCVINYTGRLGDNTALDSLSQYNRIYNTNITEEDCNKVTEIYKNCTILKSFFKDMLSWCVRTHFLKLGPGGFFPPHRDHIYSSIQSTFRLIVPIKNCNPPFVRFMLEDRSLYWNHGELYVLNTTKQHSLFNSSLKDSIWLVINAKLCKSSIDFVANHLLHT